MPRGVLPCCVVCPLCCAALHLYNKISGVLYYTPEIFFRNCVFIDITLNACCYEFPYLCKFAADQLLANI